jgi:phospholipase A1
MPCAFALIIAAAVAHANVILVPAAVSVAGGAMVSVTVMVTNPGTESMTWTVERSLSARLHSGSARSEDVVLTTETPEGAHIIPPGGYLQLPYRFRLRPGLFGPVVLELTHGGFEPVMFSVLDGGDPALASAAVAELPANDRKTVAHETALRRSTGPLPGLSRYEPVYFGVGGNGGLNAKFQLSLRYQPIGLIPFFLSYSQTSLWDLHDSSAPFHDTSYRPRIFFQKEQLWVSQSNRTWFGLEAGFGHESNGQSGSQSRSINIFYLRPRLDWVAPGDYHFFISPMIYGYLDKSDNPDITAYRGHADVLIGVNKNGWRLSTTLRKGADAHFGSIEVNAVLPLRSSERFFERLGARGLNGYWFVQYFNGWGETILDYNLKFNAQFRTGLMVVP